MEFLTHSMGRYIPFGQVHRFRAVIGSTKASPALLQAAYAFGRQSVLDGYIVVSGLAKGVDKAAHEGALSVEGDFLKTVAVVSTSPKESYYPKEHSALALEIKRNGAIVHPFLTNAKWESGKRFGQPQKRLVERDVMQATLSSEVYAVAPEGEITGGTRWALNYAKVLEIPYYRVDEELNVHENPEFQIEERLIPWKMELDWLHLTNDMSGRYFKQDHLRL